MLLYEQFIHLTWINLRSNLQFFSTQQHAYQLVLVTSWFDSVCVTVTRWVNFKEKHLHEYELQLFDYTAWKYFRQNGHISGINLFLCIFCLKNCSWYIFFVQRKSVNNTRNTHIWTKILSYIVVHIRVNILSKLHHEVSMYLTKLTFLYVLIFIQAKAFEIGDPLTLSYNLLLVTFIIFPAFRLD